MLKISNLHKAFSRGEADRSVIFSGLDLAVAPGEFVVIVGRNGTGKSTLLNIITGSDQPDAGRLLLGGREITHVPREERSAWIGRVYQDPGRGVAPSLTVLENMALAASRGGALRLIPGIPAKELKTYIGILSQLGMGLEGCLKQRVGQLSGGQKQALSLAMVVMARPSLLLLDEHTASLDPGAALSILQVTKKIVAENSLTALMVTHDLDQAVATGSRLIMLDRGEKVLDVSGAAKTQLTASKLMTYYKPAS